MQWNPELTLKIASSVRWQIDSTIYSKMLQIYFEDF